LRFFRFGARRLALQAPPKGASPSTRTIAAFAKPTTVRTSAAVSVESRHAAHAPTLHVANRSAKKCALPPCAIATVDPRPMPICDRTPARWLTSCESVGASQEIPRPMSLIPPHAEAATNNERDPRDARKEHPASHRPLQQLVPAHSSEPPTKANPGSDARLLVQIPVIPRAQSRASQPCRRYATMARHGQNALLQPTMAPGRYSAARPRRLSERSCSRVLALTGVAGCCGRVVERPRRLAPTAMNSRRRILDRSPWVSEPHFSDGCMGTIVRAGADALCAALVYKCLILLQKSKNGG
jgi:hypothetical protein